MNREQRRAFVRKAKRVGVDERVATTTLDIFTNGVGTFSPANPDIKTGDVVQIDMTKVTARKNYDKMAPAYKEFVMSSEGKLFHAVDEGHNTIHLEEAPKWLFWSGDLIRVEQESEDQDDGADAEREEAD